MKKNITIKNTLLMALALSAVTPAIVIPTSFTVEASELTVTFKDVPKGSVNYEAINGMVQKGIISGYGDGTFRPNEKITRKHVSALINRAVDLEKTRWFEEPVDLPKTHPYYEDMKLMNESGLLKVNPKGNIYPDKELSRGEMAQILAKAFGLDLKDVEKHPFRDVTDWNDQYVSALYHAGITTGFADGTFRESETVTRAQYTTFMYRTMKHVEKVDLNTLTDGEIFSMTNRQLVNYILPYQYGLHEYVPEGQTDVRDNYAKWYKEFSDHTQGFSYPFYRDHINLMSGYGVEKRATGNIGEMIKDLSENVFGLSAKETIDLINKTFLEGNFVTTYDVPSAKKDFAMFYNYGAGNMIMNVSHTKTKFSGN